VTAQVALCAVNVGVEQVVRGQETPREPTSNIRILRLVILAAADLC
jgi:hypothetical protein